MSVQSAQVNRLGVGLLARMLSAIRGPQQPVQELDGAARVGQLILQRMRDGVDPSNAILMGDLDKVFGRSFPPVGSAPSPAEFHAYGRQMPEGTGYQALGGTGGDRAFMDSLVGQSIINALRTDPQFRERFEQALGGRILPVGTQDGRLLVHQPPAGQQPVLPSFGGAPGQQRAMVQSTAVMQAQSAQYGLPGVSSNMSPILGGLMQMEQNIVRMSQDLSSNKSGPAPTGTFDDVATGIQAKSGAMGLTGDVGPLSNQPISDSMRAAMMGPGATGGAQAAMSDTARQQMLQHMLSTLRKFYELLSNIIKAMHESQMQAVRNIT